MSQAFLDPQSLRKVVETLSNAEPMVKGPVHWEIDETEDGWTIVYSGPVSGAIHPKSFCQMIIEELNRSST